MTAVHRPYFIGIAGGTGSGKTTLAQAIISRVGRDRVALIAYDDYYRDLSHLPLDERLLVNFDHPDALDTALLIQHLDELGFGKTIESPEYDFRSCTRLSERRNVASRDVIIVDGILALADDSLRSRFDLRIYMDLESDERFMRRLERDVVARGRSTESVLKQYRDTVRPMHDQFVEPSKKYADIIVPGRIVDSKALEAIAGQVMARIQAARIEALQALGIRLLSGSQEMRPVLSEIVLAAAQELGADNVTLHQFNTTTGEFLDPEIYSATWPQEGRLARPREDGLTAIVVRDGTMIIEDVDSLSHEADTKLVGTEHLITTGTKAFLGIRLQAANTTVGVLFFNFMTSRSFGSDEQTLAHVFAAYAATAIQQFRLLEQAKQRLLTISSVGAQLVSGDFKKTKDEIAKQACIALGADNVTLHQFNATTGEFLDPEIYSATWPQEGRLARPREDGLTAIVVRDGTMIIEDVDSLSHEADTKLVGTEHLVTTGTKAFLGIRLQAVGEGVGVLFFNFCRPHSFVLDEQALVDVFASYAATAIHLQRVSDKFRELGDVAGSLLSSDLRLVQERIVRLAQERLGSNNAVLHQYDNYQKQFLDPERYSAAYPPSENLQRPRESGFSTLVLQEGILEVSNLGAPLYAELFGTSHLIETGTQAFLGARLGSQEEPLGVLFCNFPTPRDFTAEERSLFNVFAVYASAVVSAARTVSLRSEVRQAEHRKVVQGMANALLVTSDLPDFLQSLLDLVLDGVDAPRGTIQFINEETSQLEIVAAKGLERNRGEAIVPVGKGVTGLAAKFGTLQYVADTSVSTSGTGFLPYLGNMCSEMAMPLRFGGKIFGVLNAEHPDCHAFDKEKQDLFELIADQAAITINQKLSLDAEIRRRQEAENKALLTNITLDMQHFIGNKVGIIRLTAMDLLTESQLSEEGSLLRSKIQKILDNAVSALKASRHVLELRKPSVSQPVKPDVLINEMLNYVDLAQTIRLHIDIPSDLPLVVIDKDRVVYSLQDLVANAQKAILTSERASGSITITGRLSDDERFVEFLFSNDGPPIEKSKLSKLFQGPGFGLPTARALLEGLSGSIELQSSTTDVTSFLVRLPVRTV